MDRQFQLHFELDNNGHPTTAVLMEVREGGQLALVAAEDFGPFDDRLGLTQWLLKRLSHALPIRMR